VCAIVGIVFFGIILGPITIFLARGARRRIPEDPELGGDGVATAGWGTPPDPCQRGFPSRLPFIAPAQ